ncbi:MAG: TrkH family potassium uptake protein [Desulfitobacteriia bacterium]|jgi:trk system potassium uptake protein TrkH
MNLRIIEALWGRFLIFYGIVMIFPLAVALFYREDSVQAFVLTIIGAVFLGLVMYFHGHWREKVGLREGLAAVAGIWVLASFFGSLPYIISGVLPAYIDALFEAVSGLTTTGASVLGNLEELPKSILLWRSFSQWLGGMGIIVLFIGLLPNIGIGAVHLFNAEVPGPLTERVLPKIKDTARALWIIYVSMTLIQGVLLYLAGMTPFEAVNHTLSSISTGGFSTRTSSIAAYNSFTIEFIIAFFMFWSGANYFLFINAWRHRSLKFWQDTEFRNYLIFIFVGVVIVTFSLIQQQGWEVFTAARQAVFQVISFSTSTGFNTVDYDQWPNIAKMVLFIHMFVGGCAASTSGGLTVARVTLLFKMGWAQIKQALHPRLVVNIVVQNRVVDVNTLSRVGTFFFLFIAIFALASLLLTLAGLEPFEALGAAVAALGNVGPAFGFVGPTAGYALVPPFGKIVLAVCMLLGRLELFTFLVLLQPDFWKARRGW